MSEKIRVVVADDHPIVRQGVVALLEDESDIEVVAAVADGRAALSAVLAENPDVVLMDLRMPEMDGVEATKAVRARRSEVAVLVLTTYDTDEAIVRAVEAGAAGYGTSVPTRRRRLLTPIPGRCFWRSMRRPWAAA
jgi:DNA-binding NarL/FixJ family response regulator